MIRNTFTSLMVSAMGLTLAGTTAVLAQAPAAPATQDLPALSNVVWLADAQLKGPVPVVDFSTGMQVTLNVPASISLEGLNQKDIQADIASGIEAAVSHRQQVIASAKTQL